VEECERITGEVLQGDLDNVPRSSKPGVRISERTLGLEPSRPEPVIGKGEALTAMIVLAVVNSKWASVLKDRAIPRYSIRNTREHFRQVERGIGVVTDSEKEHLPVEIVHATDRAFRNMRGKGKGIVEDLRSMRSCRRECL
jgi:hypothetical protein